MCLAVHQIRIRWFLVGLDQVVFRERMVLWYFRENGLRDLLAMERWLDVVLPGRKGRGSQDKRTGGCSKNRGILKTIGLLILHKDVGKRIMGFLRSSVRMLDLCVES